MSLRALLRWLAQALARRGLPAPMRQLIPVLIQQLLRVAMPLLFRVLTPLLVQTGPRRHPLRSWAALASSQARRWRAQRTLINSTN